MKRWNVWPAEPGAFPAFRLPAAGLQKNNPAVHVGTRSLQIPSRPGTIAWPLLVTNRTRIFEYVRIMVLMRVFSRCSQWDFVQALHARGIFGAPQCPPLYTLTAHIASRYDLRAALQILSGAE